jgi:nucleotide-binding universal stress UspA family protein
VIALAGDGEANVHDHPFVGDARIQAHSRRSSCIMEARVATVIETGAGVSNTYPHIAVCVDRSDASADALAEARALRAGSGPGRLSILHVAPWPLLYTGEVGAWTPDPEDIAAAARVWLADTAADVPDAEPVLLEGYPPAAVCEWAEANDVNVIVAASHRGLVERVLLGSFAGYLVRHAPCSVLLTRPSDAAK